MRKAIGMMGALLLLGGTRALANDETTSMDKAGSMGSMDSSMGGQELTGRVVRIENQMLFVEHMGAVIPLKVDAKTRFEDPTIKKLKDLKPGQDVRASFEVEKVTTNRAKTIALDTTGSGRGGSGVNDTKDSKIPEDKSGPETMPAPSAPPAPPASPSDEPGSSSNRNPTY